MKKRALFVATVALALAACGETATAPQAEAPTGPRMNGGGVMFGGGTAVQVQGDPTTDECGDRGGMMFGGGTYTGPISCPDTLP